MKKQLIALTLACLMLVGLLTGCGGGGGSAGDDTTFSWWIYSGANSSFYTEYQENPAVQYTLTKGYGSEDKKVAFEFWAAAPGKEADNYSTMLVSGDLPDIIDEVISDPPPVMVEKGYALDITEYVERNMPNYVALVHSNETYLRNAVVMVDGEEHYYDLKTILDAPEDVFHPSPAATPLKTIRTPGRTTWSSPPAAPTPSTSPIGSGCSRSLKRPWQIWASMTPTA